MDTRAALSRVREVSAEVRGRWGEEIAREKLAPGAGDVVADSRSYKSRREGRSRVTPFRRDCSPIKCIRVVSGVGIGIGVGRRDAGNWLLKFRDNRGKFCPVCSATFQTQKSARLSRDRGRKIGWMALWRLCQMDRPTDLPAIPSARFPCVVRVREPRASHVTLGAISRVTLARGSAINNVHSALN